MTNLSQKLSLAIALASALALSACGMFEKDDDSPRKIDEIESELTGQWQSACEATGPLGIIDLNSKRQNLDFGVTGNFARTTHQFSDTECQEALYERKLTATYAVVGDTPDVEGAKNLNVTVHKVEMTPASEDAAATMNDSKLCDKTDWQATVAKDVTGLKCDGTTFSKGQVIFDIYDVEDDNLLLGEASFFLDGSGADERPTKLDREHPLTKQ